MRILTYLLSGDTRLFNSYTTKPDVKQPQTNTYLRWMKYAVTSTT